MRKSGTERRRGFREVIESFLRERLEEKFKENAQDYAALCARYTPDIWIADAARRVGQIQAVTHTLKATHPDAKGSSMYCIPDSAGREALVGSHQLSGAFVSDIVGNAAALDVYKFLRCEYEGKSLLAWMREGDEDLLGALHSDAALARKWADAFAGLVRQPASPASHTWAKQIYWLVGDDPANDGHYHLLSPLHPSSLAHKIFEVITEDRFGDAAKETRRARRAGVYSDKVLRDYPNLAVRKLGGTRPQNISQLNSERGGVNYLLASLPPVWKPSNARPPWGIRPLFEQFGRRRDLARLVACLKNFLEHDPAPTWETRERRDNLLDQIIGEVRQYADELRALEPGWSADSRCRLAEAEALWLDPGRAALDAEFAENWRQGRWQAEVQHRFVAWLNPALGERLPLGDIEHAFRVDALLTESWQRQTDAGCRRMEEHEAGPAWNS